MCNRTTSFDGKRFKAVGVYVYDTNIDNKTGLHTGYVCDTVQGAVLLAALFNGVNEERTETS